MTISSETRTTSPFVGNGSITSLPFTFKVFSTADVAVIKTQTSTGDETTLTLTTDYSVTLNANQEVSPGGTVTLVTALATGYTAVVDSNIACTQPTSLQNGFLPVAVTQALDRQNAIIAQLKVRLSRAFRFSHIKTAANVISPDEDGYVAIVDGQPQVVTPSADSSAELALTLAATGGAAEVGANDGASGANYNNVQEGLDYLEGLIDDLPAPASAAADITIADAASLITSGNVEGALQEIFKQRSWQTRGVPDAVFSSFGIKPTVGATYGQFGYTETVAEYAKRVHSALIGTGTVWVDPVNGNDANSGTVSSPVQTLDYAVTTLGASLALCLPGVYEPFEFRTTDAQGAKLKIVKALGRCVIRESTDDATTATWTADGTYPNCWYMTTTTGHKDVVALLDSTRLDEEGQQMNLVKYSSLALLNAVADGDGWYFDSATKKLYVRYLGSVNVNTVKTRFTIIKGDSTSRILVYGTKLLFEGDWGFDGVFLQPLVYSTTKPILYMDIFGGGVTVRHTSSHGLDALGADTYIAGAWFHRCQGDNLHYADSGAYSCNAVEIDCKATKAGDYDAIRSAPNTSNGSSIHGAANIIRINGVYRRNYGPDIVDTGTGKSWNCGVDQGPAMDSGNAYGIYTTGPSMWLDTCRAKGNKQADIAATTSGPMYIYSTSYRTTSESSGGTIIAYTPV